MESEDAIAAPLTTNEDLHGNVPDDSPAAILIVDMINDLEFPGAEALFEAALPAAKRIAELKRRACAAGIPAIYVNDNFGKWRSDFRCQVRHCLDHPVRGRPIARLLEPAEEDYYVLKPKHSGFYATPLDLLLAYLKATTVILTGITADDCVTFTAGDAFIREYRLIVPADCIASESPARTARSLEWISEALDADVRPSIEIDVGSLRR
ncbi:MAG TPA: isochorismatase family cysteine hydrolase [Chthonomonadaceae bacterium]|nr:isochorismatase family cysteine hydrolase [Chthonomonadaceae bacterium]